MTRENHGGLGRDEVKAECVDCHKPFSFDAEWYRAKSLSSPRRCASCREARRSSWITVSARIERVADAYVFAHSDDQLFFISPRRIPPGMLPLDVGDIVELSYDPTAPVPPGAKTVAVRLRPRWTPRIRPPRGRPNPATTEVAFEAVKVYRVASSRCKSARVLVRQLLGPHLRT
jgi:hypothetical protein